VLASLRGNGLDWKTTNGLLRALIVAMLAGAFAAMVVRSLHWPLLANAQVAAAASAIGGLIAMAAAQKMRAPWTPKPASEPGN
jgi:hypothetical protein